MSRALPRPTAQTVARASEPPIVFRWRIEGAGLPPLTAAQPLMRAVRAALMRTGNLFGIAELPDSFHHGGEGRDSAYYLPEDLDGDGCIDHVVCLHEPELPPELLPSMAAGGTVRLGRGPPWALRPVHMGGRMPGGVFGPARRWQAMTPFVTPFEVRRRAGQGARGPRRGRSLIEQILRLIEARGLPRPLDIVADPCGADVASARARARRFLGARPNARRAGAEIAFPELIFTGRVWGPIAIGVDCHFGLGVFAPIE